MVHPFTTGNPFWVQHYLDLVQGGDWGLLRVNATGDRTGIIWVGARTWRHFAYISKTLVTWSMASAKQTRSLFAESLEKNAAKI